MTYDKKELNKIPKELTGKTASGISDSKKKELASSSSNSTVLTWLAGDEEVGVRRGVAENPNQRSTSGELELRISKL